MTRPLLVPIVILASTIGAIAAPAGADPASKQLQVYPKNLARQHLGANMFQFDAATGKYGATQAAAAWLDDDISTGFAPMAGKQDYLIALPEPQVVTNFSLSTKAAQGTVSIFGSDEPAAPGEKVWVPLVRDVPIETINEKKLAHPFSRLSKYILIETNIADPGPVYSVNVYGERPATAFQVVKRDQAIDVKSLFGSYVNEPTALNRASLYAGGRVTFSTDGSNPTGWQKAIDENPESAVSIAPTKDDAGFVAKFADKQTITRLSLLTSGSVKGKLDVFLVPAPAEAGADSAAQKSISVAGLNPTTTFDFDGTNARQSRDLPGVEAGAAVLRWTPENGVDALSLREINAFSGFSLADSGVQESPEAIAELAKADGKGDGKDAKALAPVKELLPIGEGFNRKPPYLPPSLGFPPPIPPRVPPRTPPQEPPGLSN